MIKFTKNFYQKGVRKKVISLGLDSGSSMTKAVLFKDDHIIKTKMIPTSISPRKSLEELYLDMINEKERIDVVVRFMIITIVLLIIANIVLYRTRLGLRLMACGKHPQAADSVGINVYKMRYIGVLISGFLGGLGGIVYITAGVSEWKFENGVAGFGFLALAVMIFGQWKPNLIALAVILFGLFRALSNVYAGFDFLTALNIPGTYYKMLPYIISLLVLAVSSKKSRVPKAEGIPYDKGQR